MMWNDCLSALILGTAAVSESDVILLLELASKYEVLSLREKCGELLFSEDKDIASLMVRMPICFVYCGSCCCLLLVHRS